MEELVWLFEKNLEQSFWSENTRRVNMNRTSMAEKISL